MTWLVRPADRRCQGLRSIHDTPGRRRRGHPARPVAPRARAHLFASAPYSGRLRWGDTRCAGYAASNPSNPSLTWSQSGSREGGAWLGRAQHAQRIEALAYHRGRVEGRDHALLRAAPPAARHLEPERPLHPHRPLETLRPREERAFVYAVPVRNGNHRRIENDHPPCGNRDDDAPSGRDRERRLRGRAGRRRERRQARSLGVREEGRELDANDAIEQGFMRPPGNNFRRRGKEGERA